MEKQEAIIQVGAEGGTITLYGRRLAEGWQFSLGVWDQMPELIGEPATGHTFDAGYAWRDALAALDRYPWHTLFPLKVHPEFRSSVLEAVSARASNGGGPYAGRSAWQQVCGAGIKDTVPVGGLPSEQKKMEAPLNVVYVLSNPAMPGYIKIGYTKQIDAQARIDQLYTTGVPVPFDLEFACKVPNAEEVEKALHVAFGPARVNPKREFFKIDPDQAIAILKLLHVKDATTEVEQQPSTVDAASVQAGEQLKAKRPAMNFQEMGIPLGAMLQSIQSDATAEVCGPKKVKFNGEVTSLTAATREVLGLDYSVQPSPHWTYEGKTLKQWYDDTYSPSE